MPLQQCRASINYFSALLVLTYHPARSYMVGMRPQRGSKRKRGSMSLGVCAPCVIRGRHLWVKEEITTVGALAFSHFSTRRQGKSKVSPIMARERPKVVINYMVWKENSLVQEKLHCFDIGQSSVTEVMSVHLSPSADQSERRRREEEGKQEVPVNPSPLLNSNLSGLPRTGRKCKKFFFAFFDQHKVRKWHPIKINDTWKRDGHFMCFFKCNGIVCYQKAWFVNFCMPICLHKGHLVI